MGKSEDEEGRGGGRADVCMVPQPRPVDEDGHDEGHCEDKEQHDGDHLGDGNSLCGGKQRRQ